LQSIGLREKAQTAEAHEVAERIHRHILQEFTSGLERTNKGHERQITNEEAEEESIDDHFFGNRGSSKDCNATLSRTSLPSHFHGFHEDQEHLGLAGDAGNPMMGDNQQHSHHLASAFNGEELRGTLSRPRGFVLG